MSLFHELKRRNVIRMGGLYLVGAWLIAQIAETLLPIFHTPDWVLQVLVVLLAIGFLPVLVFAWIFELTPQGIRRDGDVAPDQSIAPHTAQRMNRVIIALLVAALGYFVVDKFVLTGQREEGADEPIARTVAPPSEPATPEIAANTIAVLPFENLSSDPDNAYFAIGIQDEILTRLSKIQALRVISRTSTMNIASKPGNLPEIAKMLGAAAILEGSVQKSANQVRINVQLIRAASDEHLWAESYDRKLDDVFAVQGEVAQAVADALGAALTDSERQAIAVKSTTNTKAYEYYLRGLALEGRYTSSGEEIQKRIDAYQKAVELDPLFALAWAGLSAAHVELYFSQDHTPARLAEIKQALDQAERLAPDATETWIAKGTYLYLVEKDYDGAFAALSKALQARPNDGLIVYLMGIVRRRQAHWEEALPLQQRATELDPLATNTWFNYGMTLRALRKYDDAQAAFDRGLAAVPGDPELLGQKLVTFLAVGDLASAEKFVQSLPPEAVKRGVVRGNVDYLGDLRRDYPARIDALKKVLADPDNLSPEEVSGISGQLGHLELLNGDRAAGIAHLTKDRDLMQKLRSEGSESPYLLKNLAEVNAEIGNSAAAYQQSDLAAQLLANDAIGLPQAIETQAYARMLGGDKEEAITLLRKTQALPMAYGPTPALLRLDPRWDPLREQPGFDALLEENAVPLQTMPAVK